MSKLFTWLVVIVIVIVAIVLLSGGSTDNGDVDTGVSEEKMEGEAMMEGDKMEEGGKMGKNVIVYTDEGYSPKELTVNVGDTVTFKNESSAGIWTASAMHPTHTVYPGSDIKKCGSPEAESIFDSCEQTFSNSEWSFTFDEIGEWGYHNHVRSSHFGKVIVK